MGSGDPEVQGTSRFDVCQGLTRWFVDGHLPVSSHGGRDEGALWGLFYNGTNSIH